jgi:CRP/FNR family transcriptional regulator
MELTESGGTVRSYEDGETIIEEGDEGHFLYIVLNGTVLIRKQGGELFETVLAECSPGEMFGELAMIDFRPHSASAVAVGDTELALYDRETFLNTIREDPEFSLRVISSLGERLRATTEQLQRMCGEYVRDRAEIALVQKAVLEGEIS